MPVYLGVSNWNTVQNKITKIFVKHFSPTESQVEPCHEKTCLCHMRTTKALFLSDFYGPSTLFHSFRAEPTIRWRENGILARKPTWLSSSRTWLSHLWSKRGLNTMARDPIIIYLTFYGPSTVFHLACLTCDLIKAQTHSVEGWGIEKLSTILFNTRWSPVLYATNNVMARNYLSHVMRTPTDRFSRDEAHFTSFSLQRFLFLPLL